MIAGLAGCHKPASDWSLYTTEAMLSGASGSSYIVLDGDTADWPPGAVITANEHYLYIRFTIEDQQFSLQAAPVTTAVMLDVDGDETTGRLGDTEPTSELGVDLEIDFSPRDKNGPTRGISIYSLDSRGHKTPLTAADIDFSVAPTYASSWYECRISRTPTNAGALPLAGMLTRGTVRGLVATLDANGNVDAYSDPFTVDVVPASSRPFLSSQDMPHKPAGAVRVMTYNVEKSSPTTKPELFRRIFQAINPDVILLEEWDAGDAAAMQAWFTALVSGDSAWSVHKAEGTIESGGGVAIASRFPLSPLAGDSLTLPGTAPNSPEHKIRFVAGRITTPYGDMLTGCMHLKCCGAKDGPEDQQRLAEAKAINSYLAGLAGTDRSVMRVLGGDMNLVGSRPPLDLVRSGLDCDGSDLAIVNPLVLGDWTMQTWRDPSTPFSPGRLDYLLYSDANAQVVNTFVLDTSRLTDEELARLGLDRSDCDGSDHLPVVVDLKPGAH
jgi:endonuclease/exonuclease/phosphatase family metal-dependent hydrolase